MATIKVDVVSAEEHIFSGEAELVSLPGTSGELGIMPGHLPLITLIRPGFVRVHVPGEQEPEQIFVAGGVLEVQPEQVTVLSDTAVRSKDLDEARAKEALAAAEAARASATGSIESLVLKRRSLPWLPSLLLFANCVASSDRSQRRHSNERRCSVRTSAHFLLVCGRILRNACPRF